MKPVLTHCDRPISDLDIAVLVKYLGFDLPVDYKLFLKEYNGGMPDPFLFSMPSPPSHIGPYGEVQSFFGIDTQHEVNSILWNFKTYRRRMPLGFLPIACDPGDNIICYLLSGADVGSIWYWDHEREVLVGEINYSNCYPIADTLEEFLNNFCSDDKSGNKLKITDV
jgi:hypothetical protein